MIWKLRYREGKKKPMAIHPGKLFLQDMCGLALEDFHCLIPALQKVGSAEPDRGERSGSCMCRCLAKVCLEKLFVADDSIEGFRDESAILRTKVVPGPEEILYHGVGRLGSISSKPVELTHMAQER